MKELNPWRDLIEEITPFGETPEEVFDDGTSVVVNAPRALMANAFQAKLSLMLRLKKEGLLSKLPTLKMARIKAGLHQRELASFAGITPVTISFIENGKVSPRSNTRQKIEQVLDSKIDWERTGNKNKLTKRL